MFIRPLTALIATCISSMLLLVGGALYARYLEPRWVEETRWEITSEQWQGRPLRLAVLTDLHARASDGEYLDELVRRTLAARPDAVLLLGDYINEPRLGDSMDAETLAGHLSPLAQVPCFAVLGNHDYDYGAETMRSMLQRIGAEVLEGRVQALETGGGTLYLSGIRCLCTFDTPGQLAAKPEGAADGPLLMLSHSPAGAYYAPEEATAVVCGHTHGGQVCLPGGIPILRPDARVAWGDMAGAIEVKGKPVYVCRGLGTSMLPLRFCCRPELVVVELSAAR